LKISIEFDKMKLALFGSVLVIATAAVVYGLVAMNFEADIEVADLQIDSKSTELVEILTTPVTSPQQTIPPQETELKKESEFCLSCHEKTYLSSFHYPERIKALEEKKGKPIRICTTCHGEPAMPVHFKAIQRKAVNCEACHLREGGGFSVPEKRDEDLLVCQLCHAGGNYITIHIDGAILKDAEIDSQWIRNRDGLECIICHNEDFYGGKNILLIHEERAAHAGKLLDDSRAETDLENDTLSEEEILAAKFASPEAPTTVIEIN
jgi:hypothetical protein